MNHHASVVANSPGDNLHVEHDVYDSAVKDTAIFVLRISNEVTLQTSDPVVAATWFGAIADAALSLAEAANTARLAVAS